MRFTELGVAGVFHLELEPIADERGFFARTFCAEQFGARGLATHFAQHSRSFNHHQGTLRGLHVQAAPHAEAKLVTCLAGAVFDVAVDLRPTSPTYLAHVTLELSAAARNLIYIPEGVAHGFQTLAAASELLYHISVPYAPEAARGVRYDDPTFGIRWPLPVSVISARDLALPYFDAEASRG